jgi:hypothetical protein
MSACAGSSTKLFSQVYLSCPPEQSCAQEHYFQTFRRPGPDGSRPAGQGFMSTQRRENRSTPATKTYRRGFRYRWQRTSCTGRARTLGTVFLTPGARHGCAIANGGTAPPEFPARLATDSLHSGYRIVQPVRFVQIVGQDFRHGSPPFGAGPGRSTGTPAIHGSSPPHIPFPSGLVSLHPALPQVPAGRRRWAERYDGKGNLHLQHAA